MSRTYYDILGVSSNATDSAIKSAYKQKALYWHPDMNGGRDTTPQMQLINEAYEVLSDPEKKAVYDAKLRGTYYEPMYESVKPEPMQETPEEVVPSKWQGCLGDILKYILIMMVVKFMQKGCH